MRKVLLGTVFGLAGLLMSATARADNGNNATTGELCGIRPSCKQMGFIYTEDECKGYFALRCPWDASKVACDCTFKYMAGSSNGDITSPSCTRLGVTYYRDPCPGVLASECTNGSTVGSVICTDATGNKYYASCSDEKVCEVGDLLYSNESGDKKCFPGVAMTRPGIVSGGNPDNYTAIGVVFDATNHLAIALDENRGNNSIESYGRCDPCGLRSNANMSDYEARHYTSCYKGVAFYRHCKLNSYEYEDDTDEDKMNGKLIYGLADNTRSNIAGMNSDDAYLATKELLKNDYYAHGGFGDYPDFELIKELLPAVAYCHDYSKIGAASGINRTSLVSSVPDWDPIIGSWVLPSPRDWNTLNNNLALINNKLAAVNRLSNLSGVMPIAGVDSVVSDGKRITSDRKYWTSSLNEDNPQHAWSKKYGFMRIKPEVGPVIFDFAEGTSYPVLSTRHSVRARCMIKYAD